MNKNMGKTAVDTVTAFKGIITGFCQYLSGCDYYLLTPEGNEDGEVSNGRWFCDNQIEFK